MTAFLKSSAFATAVLAGVASGALAAAPARAAADTAAPGSLRIGYGQACTSRAGTVAFVLQNSDRHRHTVSISGKGLTPATDGGTVPASHTVVVQFDIGAKGTTVSVSVDRGAPRTQRLKGCPRGDGDQGLIAVRGKKASGKDADKPGDRPHAERPTAPTPGTGRAPAPGAAPEQHKHHAAPQQHSAPQQHPDHGTAPKPGGDHPSPSKRPTTPPPMNTT